MMDQRSAQALIRFGLGRRGNEPLPSDPVAWLTQQITSPDPATFPGQPTTLEALAAIRSQREIERLEREAEARLAQSNPQVAFPPGSAPPVGRPAVMRPSAIPPPMGAPVVAPSAMAPQMTPVPPTAPMQAGPMPPAPVHDRPAQKLFRPDVTAQINWAIDTDAPFRERLVWFWANHFTVSTRQGGTAPLVGPYLREAIRPYVTGRFTDMVLAVMRHPAMLMYLDQEGSIGPNSPAGVRQHRGLNENLARECMELHTVTPASGYTQADVTEFARILTGWTIEFRGEPLGFCFRPNAHEPGMKRLMGQDFPPGEEGGILALRYLAEHPTAHTAIATALVRHFVADDPPAGAVRRITQVLHETRGNLGAASIALIHLPEAWQPLTKLRSPFDYVIAAMRAVDLPADKRGDVFGAFGALGQPMWNAPLPNGWPDRAVEWAAPESLLRRTDWAFGLAGRAGELDPSAVAEATLGPLVRPATTEAVHRAASRRDALTLVLASAEFMRR